MARVISRAESWEQIHTAFKQINFNAFDYDTVKESLLNYVKIYYPEDYNDYIESSEFISILELFSYVAGILAYRLDLNAHENFITTAERKESILRLAKLVSYKASRNIAARGMVKIRSIRTSESIIDSAGRNIANRTITWNDANNSDWKEQFLLIINRVMEQDFGTVVPSERIQFGDVLLERYSFNNAPLSGDGTTVFPFTASSNMELVPVELSQNGPEEKRPERSMKFSFLYSYDGLGDGSDTTGFLMYAKQGTLARKEVSFDGKTPNQTYDVAVDNINNTDVWVNNVDSGGEILTTDPNNDYLTHLAEDSLRFGEWTEVDTVTGENIIFNTVGRRNKFEIETLDDDQVRLIFGDGEFATIPSGAFDIWYRTSDNTGANITKSSVQNQAISFNYVDTLGNNQTFSFTFSLISSLLNASASEDIERIRQKAPSVYYTQDRMVNARDYNSYMLQDPSILKLRSINRTFAGDSKYIAWHDPSEYYENVKMFGGDSAVYWVEKEPDDGGLIAINKAIRPEDVMHNYLEPILTSSDMFAVLAPEMESMNINPSKMRTYFSALPYSFDDTSTENQSILDALELSLRTTSIVDLYYSVVYDEWTVGPHPCDPGLETYCTAGEARSNWCIRVEAKFAASAHSGWDIQWRTKRLVAQSEDTKFWNTNTVNDLTDYNSFNIARDHFVVLEANIHSDRSKPFTKNHTYNVVGQELRENIPTEGLPDIHRLSILPQDINGDGIPDDMLQDDLLDFSVEKTYDWYLNNDYLDDSTPEATITIPYNQTYLTTDIDNDLEVYIDGVRVLYSSGVLKLSSQEDPSQIIRCKFTFKDGEGPQSNQTIKIFVKDWVYFTRESTTDRWKPQVATNELRTSWALDTTTVEDDMRIKRHHGRYPLNFAWFHFVPTFNLVDPAATNIIDSFIITEGYYNAMTQWIAGRTDIEPSAIKPMDLRSSYNYMLDSKMISDTLVLQPGYFKVLFGSKAIPELRARFKLIRPTISSLSDNEIKIRVVDSVNRFFDPRYWEFGEGFFFSELTASIHSDLGPEIDSVVLVPIFAQNQFGDMYQIQARENEMFLPDISSSDIDIVQEYTPENLRQNPDA